MRITVPQISWWAKSAKVVTVFVSLAAVATWATSYVAPFSITGSYPGYAGRTYIRIECGWLILERSRGEEHPVSTSQWKLARESCGDVREWPCAGCAEE